MVSRDLPRIQKPRGDICVVSLVGVVNGGDFGCVDDGEVLFVWVCKIWKGRDRARFAWGGKGERDGDECCLGVGGRETGRRRKEKR